MYLHTKDGWFVLRKDPFMWWKQCDGPLQDLTKLASDEVAVQISLGLIPGIYLIRARSAEDHMEFHDVTFPSDAEIWVEK